MHMGGGKRSHCAGAKCTVRWNGMTKGERGMVKDAAIDSLYAGSGSQTVGRALPCESLRGEGNRSENSKCFSNYGSGPPWVAVI